MVSVGPNGDQYLHCAVNANLMTTDPEQQIPNPLGDWTAMSAYRGEGSDGTPAF